MNQEELENRIKELGGRFRNAVRMNIGEWERKIINEYASNCVCGGEYVFYNLDAVNYKAGVCHKCGRETCMDTNFFVVCFDTSRATRFSSTTLNKLDIERC
jgi:hypothetical protein